jgi:hypothetical protein
MSLIFQSLQKLDANLEAPPSGSGTPVSDKSRSGSGSLRWMMPAAIGLVLVLALGCGAVYAVQYIKQRVPDKVRRPQMQAASYPVPSRSDVDVTDEPAAAPQAPEKYAQGATTVAPKYRFQPPDREKVAVEGQTMARVERQPPQAPASNMALPTRPPPSAHSPIVRTGSDVKTSPAPPPLVDAQRESVERARRAALEKSARIARLVRRIETALAGSTQAGDPSALLEELARLKGQHHPYVAKLRAYYNLQRGNLEAAQADLNAVIAAHPDDLEAGINLAIIEIRDQRYDRAMARLKDLRELYPENEQIADLLKRLR